MVAVNGVDGQKQGTGIKFPAENNSWFLWLAWRETRCQSLVLRRVAMKVVGGMLTIQVFRGLGFGQEEVGDFGYLAFEGRDGGVGLCHLLG